METLMSCLYECKVYHQRLSPRQYGFKNSLFLFYLNLDELPLLNRQLMLLGNNVPAFYQLNEADYLPTGGFKNLKERAIEAFQTYGVSEPIETIGMLAHVRTLGYVFNPITLFFAWASNGSQEKSNRCLGVLVQVENTFREMKLFPVLHPSSDDHQIFFSEVLKEFYVSPYSTPDQTFTFTVTSPNEQGQLACKVKTIQGRSVVLESGMTGKRLPLTDKTLLWMSLKYPFMPYQVSLFIHLHALILWLKRVPFYRKEEMMAYQCNVLKPRHDLLNYDWERKTS